MTEDEALATTQFIVAARRAMKPDDVAPGCNLQEELSFDSLDLIELIIDVGERLDRAPDIDRLTESPTVESIASLFRSEQLASKPPTT